jgi:hypothetical protein
LEQIWKWHFRDSHFKNVLGEYTPRPLPPFIRGILATNVAFSHCYPPLIYYLTERSLFKKCPPPTGKSLKKALTAASLTNCHSLMEEIMHVFRRTEIFTLLWFVAKYPLSLLIMVKIIFACTNISPALKQTFCVLLFLPKILCISDNVSQQVHDRPKLNWIGALLKCGTVRIRLG